MSSSYTGYDRYSTDAFLANSWTRTAWASVFALFALWGLTWFLRHMFGQADDVGFTSGPYSAKRGGVDPELGNTGGPGMTTADNTAYNNTGTGAYNTTGTGVGATGVGSTGVGGTGTGVGTTGTTGNNAYNTTGTTGTTGTTAYNDDPTRLGGGVNAMLHNIFLRMERSHHMLRDLMLMLLVVMTLNSFAKGLTRGAAIMGWIFFGFAVVFSVCESVVAHKYARLAYSLIFFGLALAIGGGGFAYGFWY
ncbi:hypothetical protein K450DRAFT_236097 [Umbelopsis ramanniana AG]|uniref:Uncharacterized protein n=1 Tax=Umbelopsis ramanniana AG TaxID=1314678 RepID=A0AAD5ECK0_UMBRA|nr:uncharacterized protein K450DRAFT_236097 [Umbelopsis ramanniana AG]KAI8580812.1 hypothetical protein K450DRAFT_236097 [Umbelopsis ramanniana AG]